MADEPRRGNIEVRTTGTSIAAPPGFEGDSVPTPPPGYTLKWDGKTFQAIPLPQPAAPPQAGDVEPPAAARSQLDIALSPITSYPDTYTRKRREAQEQMGRGVEQLGGVITPPDDTSRIGNLGKGLFNTAAGALNFTLSPIEAGIESIAGKPIQDVTGLPKEYTNFTLGLAMPGLGLAKTPNVVPGAAAIPATWPGPARTAEKILSPETVSPTAQDAAALIREHTGTAARATEKTGAELESFYTPASKLPQAEQWNIMNYIDGGGAATMPRTPQLRALVDTLRDAFLSRRRELESMPKFQQQIFRDEYFPHMWQDPKGAADAVRAGIGKQGSGASLKQRTIPTFEDGIQAGLKPLYDNPIDASMRYIMSMDKFIASQKILQDGIDSGLVISAAPKIVGASGRPGAMTGIPKGYVELDGRGGRGHFAPEGWARVYNNWVSPGFEQFPTGGKVYEGARKFTNAMMQSLLGFSGYHAFTMAEAAMGTEMARAIQASHKMRPGQFARAVGGYAVSPVRYAWRGRKFKDIYLGKAAKVSPEDKEIVDLLTEAGGRFSGTRHTMDLQASALGDYLTAFRRAQIRSQMAEHMREIKASPLTGTARFALSTMARTLETVNKPLFQHYIPSVKNGAQAELMADWLKANPSAGRTEKLAAARRIVDSVDNRFGEMIHDNIFWNRMLKQSAMLAMLSYSWNMGGWREIGGGIRDIARTSVGRQAWTSKADYAVSTAVNWAVLSATYQYLKTGQKPTDTDTPIRDLMAPRTGGTDQRSGLPERIIVPGIMKDVFGYYEHPIQEAINKLNPGAKMAWEGLQNKDWRDDPIYEPRPEGRSILDQLPVWLGNLFEHVAKTGMPITFQNVGKREPGSALSAPERMIGVRTAPRYLVDPEGSEAQQKRRETVRWFGRRGRGGKVGHDRAERARYGGPQ